MSDAYTRVAKPTNSTYTKVYGTGLHVFDDSLVLFDDRKVNFNGDVGAGYTKVAKPSNSTYTKVTKPTT